MNVVGQQINKYRTEIAMNKRRMIAGLLCLVICILTATACSVTHPDSKSADSENYHTL